MKPYARLLLIIKRIVYCLYVPAAVVISLFVHSAAFNLISAAVCILTAAICHFYQNKYPGDFGGAQEPAPETNASHWYRAPLVFGILWLIERYIAALPPDYLARFFSYFDR